MDIKEKALSSWENCDGCNENDKLFYINGYQKGYNQALEDKKEKKYTEEDLRKAIFLYSAWITGGAPSLRIAETAEERIKQIIQSLEPKTEQEVEFIDDTLKLVQ